MFSGPTGRRTPGKGTRVAFKDSSPSSVSVVPMPLNGNEHILGHDLLLVIQSKRARRPVPLSGIQPPTLLPVEVESEVVAPQQS